MRMTVLVPGLLLCTATNAAVLLVGGTVRSWSTPFPPASDTEIFVFNERQDVAFVDSQSLDFGVIAAGTRVNSHYVQYDPASPTGLVGGGTITFDGPVLGVATRTAYLDQDLSADGAGTSDTYFGLADTLGPYPTGADPGARGLGSAQDDLIVVIGSNTLEIDSLEIPVAGNLDGFRVFTAYLTDDHDGDGYSDTDDNCVFAHNPNQVDTDGDLYGNVCDPDIAQPNDCIVNFLDLMTMKDAYFSTPASPNWNPDADLNGDGMGISFADLAIMRFMFFAPPGPSGLTNACGN